MPRLNIDEMLNAELETKYNKVEAPKGTNPFEKAKQTNADRIRSMTDEELAEFLDIVATDGIESQYSGVPCSGCMEKTECSSCWKEWLDSEV
jgi:hypothetical protein